MLYSEDPAVHLCAYMYDYKGSILLKLWDHSVFVSTFLSVTTPSVSLWYLNGTVTDGDLYTHSYFSPQSTVWPEN